MDASPAPARTGEIPSLTSLRGLLALWVVGYHFWNDVIALFPSAELLSTAVRWGHMAVPAFFMLSGFVLAHNYTHSLRKLSARRVVGFLGRRLARIYPVHLITLLAVAAMVWVSHRAGYQLTDSGYTARDFVLNVFLVHTWVPDFSLNWNYPSWSISSEWFAYLCFPVVVAVGSRVGLPRRPWAAAAVVVCAAAAVVALMIFWGSRAFYELLLVVPTFAAGVAVRWAVPVGVTASGWVARWSGVAGVGVLAASSFVPEPAVAITLLLCGSLGLIAALAWAGDQCHPIWKSKPLTFLGEVSYSLYMTHTLAQKIVYKLLPSSRFVESDALTRVGVLAAYAGLIAVCCLVTYFAVERPCRRLFRKRRDAAPVPSTTPTEPV